MITMGAGTIKEARQILLIAFWQEQGPCRRDTVEGPNTAMNSPPIPKRHPIVKTVLDKAAGGQLPNLLYYRWGYDNRPDSAEGPTLGGHCLAETQTSTLRP